MPKQKTFIFLNLLIAPNPGSDNPKIVRVIPLNL